MEEPAVATEKVEEVQTEKSAGPLSKAAGCWSSNKSVWIGLAVLLLGVIGEVLLYVLPGQYYIQTQAGNYMYGHYQLLNSLQVVGNSAVYVGAFWVGGYFAFWGFSKKKG
jgi:hypothetical protein